MSNPIPDETPSPRPSPAETPTPGPKCDPAARANGNAAVSRGP